MTTLPSLNNKSGALPDWRTDKKVTELLQRREQVSERARSLADSIAAATVELEAAHERDRRAAAERLLGRSTEAPGAVAAAQAALDRLLAEQRDVERDLPAFEEATQIVVGEAKQAAAKDLERRYRAVAKRLSAALDQASDVAEELAVLHHYAESLFDGQGGRDDVPEAAGLPAFPWHELAVRGQMAKHGDPNLSHLERFRDELAERRW